MIRDDQNLCMQNDIDRLDDRHRPLCLLNKQWQRKQSLAQQSVFIFASTSCLTLIFAFPAKAQYDPYFASELAPGETQPFITTSTYLQAKQKPDPSSEDVTGFVIKKGSTIHTKYSVYQTLIPNQRTLVKPYRLEVVNHGTVKYISKRSYYSRQQQVLLHLEAGDAIKVLQYRAEGDYFLSTMAMCIQVFALPARNLPQ